MAEAEPDFYSDLALIAEPRGYFDAMRARCPVALEPHHGTMMVTGYAEVMEVLTRKDDSFSSAVSVIGPIPPLPFTLEGDDVGAQIEAHRDELPWSEHLVCFDGKKHAEHRALLTSLLTHKRLKANEEYLHALADRLIDGFIARGQCNIVPEYGHATTTYAISDLLGIPPADRAELLELIGAPPSQIDGDAVHKVGTDPLIFMKPRFDGYLRDRLANPRDDLLSELIHSRFKDGSAPDLDMVSNLARFLFGAGQDTTSRLIAMAIKLLGDDPALQARLRDEPARITDFLEEVLRYDAPVKVVYRIARRNTRIGGVEVPAGTIVTIALTAANHDPAQFEAPGEFNLDRPKLRDNMAFSRGAHGCLGAPLARMEARIAIERILARTSEIRISEAHHGPPDARRYRYEPTYSFRSLAELYVEFTSA
jgi:cytochrome P450